LNGHHIALAGYPKLAAPFADLTRELRFSNLGDVAKAAYIAEVLMTLADDREVAAHDYCRRAIAQLEDEYAARTRVHIENRAQHFPINPTHPEPEYLQVIFERCQQRRALTITVTASSSVVDDLVAYNLTSRPFIRDLVTDSMLLFWSLLSPRGAYLLLKDEE